MASQDDEGVKKSESGLSCLTAVSSLTFKVLESNCPTSRELVPFLANLTDSVSIQFEARVLRCSFVLTFPL